MLTRGMIGGIEMSSPIKPEISCATLTARTRQRAGFKAMKMPPALPLNAPQNVG